MPAGMVAADFVRVPCPGLHALPGPMPVPPGHLNPPGHNVCKYCKFNVQNFLWMKQAQARMDRGPPPIETNAYRGFWTRMCADCEIAEELLYQSRLPGAPIVGVAPPLAAQNAMNGYPADTCTCLPKLRDTSNLCIQHQIAAWRIMKAPDPPAAGGPRPAPTQDQLVVTRNRNRDWLRSIAYHVPTGQTCSASQARKIMRINTQRYRACRCGREVVPHANARILLCMGCEGVWRTAPVPGVGAGFIAGPQHFLNHFNATGAVTNPVLALDPARHFVSMALQW